MENLAGQQIKGYELKERIAAGGFGAVYRATQSTVGREVAIKVILPGLANKPDFIRRFEAEAQLIARLEHMNIVPLHDYWRDPDGAYLVMRYLRGGSLHDTIQKQGALTIEEIINLFSQVAQGLHVAHRNQVIHRDIKPGNILLDEDSNAYLADFGIAKDHTTSENITEPDSFIGSPKYLAPEQARSEAVTPQTDIYSLGVVLYEMLSGEHPFPGLERIEVIFKHLNDALPYIDSLEDSICDDINSVIQKATAKDPRQRFTDVVEMMQALRQAAQLDKTPTATSLVELLTPREQEVMQLIIDGKSNREIADILVLTEGTVKQYINSIYRKLKVRSRVQAIVRARELNFVVQKPEARVSASTGHLPEPENPYKGLQAFQAADAQHFFGREKLIKKLLGRLQENTSNHRFLAVVGPSGSGKSSVVKAGLIPALWRGDLAGSENWYVVDMLPGERPLDELEVALTRIASDTKVNIHEQLERDSHGLHRLADMILPDDGSEILLVIDQFEEVFTLLEDEDDRVHFLHLLKEAVNSKRSRVRVIVTLRADYYDKPLQYPDFGELMRTRVETVLPLGAEELEQVIHEPAYDVGVNFEDGLVSRIVSDVHYQPGALPLLQYALTELFERRDGRTLTQQAYLDIGGTGGALANRADELFHEGSEAHQELIRQMFLRLVTLGEGAEDTRRRVERSELLDIASDREMMDEIIDVYAESRLLSLDNDPATRRPTVEVAHEAILREWERLRTWLNDSRDDIRQERNLARATADWDAHNRDSSYLLRGSRLEQVEGWQQSTQLTLTQLEKYFIETSLLQRSARNEEERKRIEDKQAQETHQKQLEKRNRTVLQALIAVFALATIIAGGFGIFALNRQNVAVDALDAAEQSAIEAEQSADEFRSIALTFGAQSALDNGEPDVALALAQEAINMDNPPFAAQQTFFQTSNSTWIQQRFLVSDTRVWDSIYHPDGERIITTSWDGRTIIWDIETGEELQSIQREGRPSSINVHPDGHLVAVGGFDNLVQLWNLDTNNVDDLFAGDARHFFPVFTPDGTHLITSNDGTTINIWDIETLNVIHSFEAHDAILITSIHLSPDNQMFITSANNGITKIWDMNTYELLQTLENPLKVTIPNAQIWDAQFLADGERVLATGNSSVWLWNWRTGETIWEQTETGLITYQDIALSPDGKSFIIAMDDPNPGVQLRYIDSGNLIRAFAGHTARVQNIDFSPDGQSFLSAGSFDGTAIIWTINWEGTVSTIKAKRPVEIEWHPTQDWVAVIETSSNIAEDGVIRIVNIHTNEVIHELYGHRENYYTTNNIEFTPDGRFLISAEAAYNSSEISVYIWDIQTGEQVFRLDQHEGFTVSLAISPDSHTLAVGEIGGSGRILLWDIETGNQINELLGHPDWVNSMVFSPDGQFLYSAGQVGSLFEWNIETVALSKEFITSDISISEIDINSDGTHLAIALNTGEAHILDIESKQLLFTIRRHIDRILDIEYSPDGDSIMTSSNDGSIALWASDNGEFLRTYVSSSKSEGLTGSSVASDLRASFSSDGAYIASIINDQITIWDGLLLPDEPVTWIRDNRYIPDFTCDQRALYRIEPLCEDEDS